MTSFRDSITGYKITNLTVRSSSSNSKLDDVKYLGKMRRESEH